MSAKGLPEGDPCEREHPFGVGSKDLEGWRRTSKGVLSSCIEPGASLQPVFDCLRLLFAKGTQWVCGRVKEIYVGFQQRSVAGSKARKEDRVLMVANGLPIFRPGEPAIHLHCLGIFWWWVCECSTEEGSRGCVGNGPRRVSRWL